ncbi:hypothetical protein KKF55_01290 [Patescibacteria group bacterium]|nr:hypothetical protein [Patescibacteria group bacterium]
MQKKDEDITPAVLLDHIQYMQRTLTVEIKKNREEIKKNSEEIKKNREGISKNSVSIQNNGERIDRLRVNLTGQLDGIDKRLDEIEIEQIPKRIKVLEEAVLV